MSIRSNKHGITTGLVVLILGLLLAACDSPGSETAKSAETNKPKNDKADVESFGFGVPEGTCANCSKNDYSKIALWHGDKTNGNSVKIISRGGN